MSKREKVMQRLVDSYTAAVLEGYDKCAQAVLSDIKALNNKIIGGETNYNQRGSIQQVK